MSPLLASLFLCTLQIARISCAAYASGHSKCSVVKLYPQVLLEIKIENVSYYDVYSTIYSNKTAYGELFYSIRHSLNYAYNKSYGYEKDIGAFLAKCKTSLRSLSGPQKQNASTAAEAGYDGIVLFFDMEAYDNKYKYKMEQLFAKKYFKYKLYYEYQKQFQAHRVANYKHLYIKQIKIIDTSMTFGDRLKGFGIMIAFIVVLFLGSGLFILRYNRTEHHQKHLREIADEFGFEDIGEASQMTHIKLF